MKKKSVLLIFILILAVSGMRLWQKEPRSQTHNSKIAPITIGNTTLTVEFARTPQEITQGLSDRTEIGSDGMLFVLPSRTIPAFWMYHMQFGLDFVWIDGDRVVDITEHIPAPQGDTPTTQLPLYRPKVPVTHVLELPEGKVSELKIKNQDILKYEKVDLAR